jgi:hypothetical protein
MYQVDDDRHVADEPMETIHLYVVREGQTRPSIIPVIISILTLSFLIAIGILPLKTFTAYVSIIPTGIKTYPATSANGTLTITNGSIISQELPEGMILIGKDGIEVVTDTAVFVPAGSASGYGVAHVLAHTARAGAAENIAKLDIDTVEGSSIYIRNLQPFTGGADSYSDRFITSQDRQNAISQARTILLPQTFSGLLQSLCKETVTGREKLSVTWICQFVRYDIPKLPGVKVLSAQVKGQVIVLAVVYVARSRIFTVK